MLFEKIPQNEVALIEDYINLYGPGLHCSIEHILREWNERKVNLYHLLGDNLIISKNVSFARDARQLEYDMSEKCCGMGYDTSREDPDAVRFYRDFYSKVVKEIDSYEHYHYEYSELRERNVSYVVNSLTDPRALVRNTVDRACEITHPETGEIIKICKGAKITKTIGKLARIFGLDMAGFEKFRIAHSQVLNQKKLSGNLCLSIHPLDYMTMSDNSCGWESCMSWMNDGCYRQGTVEMMNSPVVVVAYLTASEPMKIGYHPDDVDGKYTWNSKKWRELYIIDKDFISNVKAYPYRNDELTSIVLTWLKELSTSCGYGKYLDGIHDWESTRPMINDTVYRINACTNHMYNDTENSNGLFCIIGEHMDSDYSINYSGASECMSCGELNIEVYDNEGRLSCYTCDPSFFCDDCGCEYSDRDELYELDGALYCEDCYDRHVEYDDITGEAHYEGNMTTIYLGWWDGNINGKDGIFACCRNLRCYEGNDPETYEKYWKGDYHTDNCCTPSWKSYSFVDVDDLTPEGWRLFGYKDKEEMLTDFWDVVGDNKPEELHRSVYNGAPLPQKFFRKTREAV